jgi:sortase A
VISSSVTLIHAATVKVDQSREYVSPTAAPHEMTAHAAAARLAARHPETTDAQSKRTGSRRTADMTESGGGGRRLDLRTIGRRIGGLLMIVGALLLGFVAFQLWGTSFEHARAQRELRTEFEQSLPDAEFVPQSEDTVPPVTSTLRVAETSGLTEISTPPTPETTTASGRHGTTVPRTTVPSTTVPPEPVFAPGDPVARLEIPRIGVDEIVVSGVGVEDLKKGPGHYPQTPLPGQAGNAAIAGHRTTYGAPFFNIDELAPGDEVISTTFAGRFVYRVSGTVVVSPTEVGVIAGTADSRLTLTSCHPLYSASSRIVVTAQLDVEHSTPVATVPPEPKRATTTTTSIEPHRRASTTSTTTTSTTTTTTTTVSTTVPLADAFGGSGGAGGSSAERPGPSSDGGTPAVPSLGSGWFDDTSALVDILLWSGACLLVVLAIRWATRRVGHRFLFTVLGVVPFAVALFFFYENLTRVLPAGV